MTRILSIVALLILSIVITNDSVASPSLHQKRLQAFSPKNDYFAAAVPLVNSSLLTPGHLYYSSRQLFEPRLSSTSIGRTVWYRYKATVTGRALVALTTGNLDNAPLEIAVYRGVAITALTRLSASRFDGSNTSYSTSVVFDTVKDSTYYFQIDSSPQTNFKGEFLIGLKQFGATGGLATFRMDPLFIIDGNSDTSQRSVLAANGFRSKVDVQTGISNIGTALSVSTVASTLNVAQTSWFEIGDNNSRDLPTEGTTAGTLIFTALDAVTAGLRGTATEPVFGIRRDYDDAPKLLVRFADPGQGVRANDRIGSFVVVKNTSLKKAISCRFDTSSRGYALTYQQKLANGTFGPVNVPFDVQPGEVKTIYASFAGSFSDYYDEVNLYCGNYYANIENDGLSTLFAYEQLGIFGQVKFKTSIANNLMQIKLADFQSRNVIVAVRNTGQYAGDYEIYVDDDDFNTTAVVDSICVSNAAGVCIGPAGSYYTNMDMAAGETRYVTLAVRRGNSADSGFVYLRATSTESPSDRYSGYSGFEVIKQ